MPPIISITPNFWDEKLTYFGAVAEEGKKKIQRESPEPWACSGNTLSASQSYEAVSESCHQWYNLIKTLPLCAVNCTKEKPSVLKSWWAPAGQGRARRLCRRNIEDNEATIKWKMLVFFLVFWGVAKWLFCGRISAFSRKNDSFDIFSPKKFPSLYFLFRLLLPLNRKIFLKISCGVWDWELI